MRDGDLRAAQRLGRGPRDGGPRRAADRLRQGPARQARRPAVPPAFFGTTLVSSHFRINEREREKIVLRVDTL